MDSKREIPIWFFIGSLLTVYGVLILGTGIYNLINPPPQPVQLANLHADIWWPLLLLVIGLIYTIKYWPFKAQAPTLAQRGFQQKVRLYHLRALFCTYLVWAVLNLCFAFAVHDAMRGHSRGIPFIWGVLHIIGVAGFPVGVGGLALVLVGLFKSERWARLLIIVGMSLWFLTGWVIAGLSV